MEKKKETHRDCFICSLLLLLLIILFPHYSGFSNYYLIIPSIMIIRAIIKKESYKITILFLIPYSVGLILHFNYITTPSILAFAGVGIFLIGLFEILPSLKKNKLAFLLLSLIIVVASVYFDFYPIERSIISDYSLKKAVSRELKKDHMKFTEDNLKKVKTLNQTNFAFKNIEDIPKLSNLEGVSINYTFVLKDYTPIEKLNNLVFLRYNKGPLSYVNLKNPIYSLDRLWIEDCKIDAELSSEIYPNVTFIELLDLKIENFSFISDLKSINKIWLHNCEIESLDGLEELTNLKEIDFGSNSLPENKSLLESLDGVEIYY